MNQCLLFVKEHNVFQFCIKSCVRSYVLKTKISTNFPCHNSLTVISVIGTPHIVEVRSLLKQYMYYKNN